VLKLLCGSGNGEIAAALLVSEAAVEKQIARGKRTLVRAGGALRGGRRGADPKRLESVQRAHLPLFSEGYHGSKGAGPRRPLRRGHAAVRAACPAPGLRDSADPALMALMCSRGRLPGRAAEEGP